MSDEGISDEGIKDKGREIVDRLHAGLETGDLDAVAALYAPDAELVRYDGAARGPEEVRAFYERYLANHGTYALDRIVEFRAVDDVVLWDAMVLTDEGVIMTYDVMILDDDDLIERHVPTIRGYWGG